MPPKDYAKKSPPPPPPKQAPVWLYLIAGLLVGAFGVGLAWLNSNGDKPATRTVTAPPPKAKPAAKPAAPEPKKRERKGVEYEFYTLLPEYEMPVPERRESKAAPTTPPKPLEAGSYLLQVGSFREAGDADSYRAQLALLGLTSSVQTVTINGKETWHRVRVGPYSDLKQLDEVRAMLKENKIDYMVLKERS